MFLLLSSPFGNVRFRGMRCIVHTVGLDLPEAGIVTLYDVPGGVYCYKCFFVDNWWT